MKTIIKKRSFFIVTGLLIILLIVLFIRPKTEKVIKSNESSRYEVFGTDSIWGYQIYLKGRIYIYQKNIPAIQGNIPFKSKPDAEKVASLVLEKIKKKQHPAVSIEELDSLKIHY